MMIIIIVGPPSPAMSWRRWFTACSQRPSSIEVAPIKLLDVGRRQSSAIHHAEFLSGARSIAFDDKRPPAFRSEGIWHRRRRRRRQAGVVRRVRQMCRRRGPRRAGRPATARPCRRPWRRTAGGVTFDGRPPSVFHPSGISALAAAAAAICVDEGWLILASGRRCPHREQLNPINLRHPSLRSSVRPVVSRSVRSFRAQVPAASDLRQIYRIDSRYQFSATCRRDIGVRTQSASADLRQFFVRPTVSHRWGH